MMQHHDKENTDSFARPRRLW